MSTFILIHGAWSSGATWYKVIPLLEKNGHEVIVPDLPGLGKSTIPPASVTMKSYVDFISDLVINKDEKVILVGHSLAGAIISQVAEQIPAKIEKLIYLCAFYMLNGKSLLDIVAKYPKGNALKFNYYEDGKVCSAQEESLQPVLYNDCLQEDIEFAKSILKPQATEPFGAKIQITDENYGRIPKVVIECTKDYSIPIEVQRMMIEAQPPQKVYSLTSDHSPFFSATQAVADILNQEAKLEEMGKVDINQQVHTEL